uniref:Seipin n=1 Tax=Mola mola TaxID=94237 RepID=A0A3Q3VX81_MOLML
FFRVPPVAACDWTKAASSTLKFILLYRPSLYSVFFLLLWISAFLYGSLYYSYMPNAAFSTSVHYYYRYV